MNKCSRCDGQLVEKRMGWKCESCGLFMHDLVDRRAKWNELYVSIEPIEVESDHDNGVKIVPIKTKLHYPEPKILPSDEIEDQIWDYLGESTQKYFERKYLEQLGLDLSKGECQTYIHSVFIDDSEESDDDEQS